MLLEMVHAAGFEPYRAQSPEEFNFLRPHHGFHLGLLTGGRGVDQHEYSGTWGQYRAAARSMFHTALFRKLYTYIKPRGIRHEVDKLLSWLGAAPVTEAGPPTGGSRYHNHIPPRVQRFKQRSRGTPKIVTRYRK
jgi:hypothetical protein